MIYETSHDLTIDEVRKEERAWQNATNNPFRPLNEGTLWFKIRLQNRIVAGNWILEIANPLLDHIEVFVTEAKGKILDHYRTGDSFDFSTRPIRDHFFLFPVRLRQQGVFELYIKVNSQGYLHVPLTLYQPQQLFAAKEHVFLIDSIFFSAFISLALLYFFLGAFFRDPMKLIYAGYLVAFLCFESSIRGYIFAFVFPQSPEAASLLLPGAISCLVLFGALFVLLYLDIKRYDRLLSYALKILIGFNLLVVLALPWLTYATAIAATLINLIPITLLTAFRLPGLLKSQPVATKIYLAGWAPALLGFLCLNLYMSGLLPVNFMTKHATFLGNATQALLLAWGLSRKLADNQLRQHTIEQELAEERHIRQSANELIQQLYQIKPDEHPNYHIQIHNSIESRLGGDHVHALDVGHRHLLIVSLETNADDLVSLFIFSQCAGLVFSVAKDLWHLQEPDKKLARLNKLLKLMIRRLPTTDSPVQISLFLLETDHRRLLMLPYCGRNYLVRQGHLRDLKTLSHPILSLQAGDRLVFKTRHMSKNTNYVTFEYQPQSKTGPAASQIAD
jgi:hypothetical protein